MTAVRVLPELAQPSERDFCDQILDAARIFKWRSAHFRPALTSKGWRTPVQGDGAGFPDLILVRGSRLIVAELKVPDTKRLRDAWRNTEIWSGPRVTAWVQAGVEKDLFKPGQIEWLTAFVPVGAESYVWMPDDLDHIIQILKGREG